MRKYFITGTKFSLLWNFEALANCSFRFSYDFVWQRQEGAGHQTRQLGSALKGIFSGKVATVCHSQKLVLFLRNGIRLSPAIWRLLLLDRCCRVRRNFNPHEVWSSALTDPASTYKPCIHIQDHAYTYKHMYVNQGERRLHANSGDHIWKLIRLSTILQANRDRTLRYRSISRVDQRVNGNAKLNSAICSLLLLFLYHTRPRQVHFGVEMRSQIPLVELEPSWPSPFKLYERRQCHVAKMFEDSTERHTHTYTVLTIHFHVGHNEHLLVG